MEFLQLGSKQSKEASEWWIISWGVSGGSDAGLGPVQFGLQISSYKELNPKWGY